MKTTVQERINVATEIWRQIRCGVGVTVLMSWGLSKRVATEYNGMPALQMRVTGLQHKGWVYVCYNYGMDAYEVFFVTVRGTVKRHWMRSMPTTLARFLTAISSADLAARAPISRPLWPTVTER